MLHRYKRRKHESYVETDVFIDSCNSNEDEVNVIDDDFSSCIDSPSSDDRSSTSTIAEIEEYENDSEFSSVALSQTVHHTQIVSQTVASMFENERLHETNVDVTSENCIDSDESCDVVDDFTDEDQNVSLEPSDTDTSISFIDSPLKSNAITTSSCLSNRLDWKNVQDETTTVRRTRKKFVRAGFAQRLNKMVQREQSAVIVWKYEKRLSSRSSQPESKTFKITQLRRSTVHYITECVTADDAKSSQAVLFLEKNVLHLNLSPGCVVKIHMPWSILNVSFRKSSVIVCTNFVEVVSRDETFQKIEAYDWEDLKDLDATNGKCSSDDVSDTKETLFKHMPLFRSTVPYSLLKIIERKGNDCLERFALVCTVQRVVPDFVEDCSIVQKRWTVLLMDGDGTVCELRLLNETMTEEWNAVLNGEGKTFWLNGLRIIQKATLNSSPKLFTMTDSFYKALKKNAAPLICYLLRTTVNTTIKRCIEDFVSLYAPVRFVELADTFKGVETQRVSVVAKPVFRNSEELWVVDRSTLNSERAIVAVRCVSKVFHCTFESSCVLLLRDLYYDKVDLVADCYTTVTCYTCNKITSDVDLNLVERLKDATIASMLKLNADSDLRDVVEITGIILEPDEKLSYICPICDVCKGSLLDEGSICGSELYCETCRKTVNDPIMKISLEVYVKCRSLPSTFAVRVKLKQETIATLIPLGSVTMNEGCKVSCVENKPIDGMICCVVGKHETDDGTLFILQEV